MNSAERKAVREALIERGFDRTGYTADHEGVGDYTETWQHADGSTIEINWSPRTSLVHLLVDTGRAGSLAACDEPFANGRPGTTDLSEVTCGSCLALFPARPRA